MRSLLTLLIAPVFLFSTLKGSAQSGSGTITGQLQDDKHQPLGYATVTLLKASDSSLVKGAISAENGKYEFEGIANGRYLVGASSIGLERGFSGPFSLEGKVVHLPVIALKSSTNTLKGVSVTATKPFIEQKADKMVVNVENSIVSAGGTALEVLQKAPGVMVDKDDNISLKGKSGVVIMIDGKETHMSAADVAQYLKSMPSSNIEKIELISNPSAKYDAEGNAGIINIILKKNSNYGTNGDVNLGFIYGKTPKYTGGLNLNHRSAKLNLFGSYNYSHWQNEHHMDLYRSIASGGSASTFNEAQDGKFHSDYHGIKAGMDYSINEHHTVGVQLNSSFNQWTSTSFTHTEIGINDKIDSILETNSIDDSKWNRWAYNLNYKGELDTSGQTLAVDLDYATNSHTQPSHIYANTFDQTGKHFQSGDTTRSFQPSQIDIKTAKVDYTLPMKNNVKLEAGIKLSYVKTDNDARYDSLRADGWEKDLNRSNHFIYNENVNAAYLNFSKQYKKLGIQAGLRAEQSHVKGNSVTLSEVNDTTYLNLFPSVFLSYQANKNNQFGISYSRRIRRPDYEDLNPFEYYLDRYTMAAGNPYLQPQFTNKFELTHTFRQFLNTSLGYAHTKDLFTRVIEQDETTKIARYVYKNVNSSDHYSLDMSAPVTITKWWTTFTNVSAFYDHYQTIVDERNVDIGSFGFFGQTQQTFTIAKGFTTELSFMYISPQIADEGLFRMRSMYPVSIGFQQKVLHDKGSIKLNVNDIFNTQRFHGTFDNQGNYISLGSRWESRQVRLNFTYRFGNNNVKAARNHRTGIEDEQSRIQNGGGN